MTTPSVAKEWRAEWDSNPRFEPLTEGLSAPVPVSAPEAEARGSSPQYATRITEELTLAFWGRVSFDAGCWVWTGKTWGGYSRFVFPRAGAPQFSIAGYRLAYELVWGVIPAGLEVDHTCGNYACINPFHLEAVTHAVNIQRSWARIPTLGICSNGHARQRGVPCVGCRRDRARRFRGRRSHIQTGAA